MIAILCIVLAIGFRAWARCGSSLMGALVGLIAYNLTISVATTLNTFEMPATWLQMVLMGAGVGLGFLLGCLLKKTIIIISTAVAGGYTFVSGVGTLNGQFPEPYFDIEGWVWWSWLAGAVMFMVIGMIMQCCTYKKEEDQRREHEVLDY